MAKTAAKKNGTAVNIPKAKTRYTRDQLEYLVFAQLENIERYNQLLELIKEQNAQLEAMNKAVKKHIEKFKGEMKLYPYSNGRKRKPSR